MRGAVFADTGFWIARLSLLDQLHAKAREISHSLRARQVVTTELVLAETLNAFSTSGQFVRGLAVRLGGAAHRRDHDRSAGYCCQPNACIVR